MCDLCPRFARIDDVVDISLRGGDVWVLEPPLVLVSELPFFFLDVLMPLIAKAGEARVLAVISTIAVTMAIIAKVVVFIYIAFYFCISLLLLIKIRL